MKLGAITASGSYVVTRNLTGVGTCLSILASFVTIDLGGFTLTGNGTGEGVSDLAAQAPLQGIAIRNGMITNFDKGIQLGASGGIIERIHVIANTRYGILTAGRMLVRDNVAYHNGVDGINVGTFSLIVNNVSDDNGTAGLGTGIGAGDGSTVIGNTAAVNSQHGFALSEGVTVVNNTARVNQVSGINIDCPSNLISNTATVTQAGPNLVLNGGGCNSSNNVAP